MQSDMLGSRYCKGQVDFLCGQGIKKHCCDGYGRGYMHGRGDCDESGSGIVSGEIGDTGDGAGSAEGYGIEDGTSEEV